MLKLFVRLLRQTPDALVRAALEGDRARVDALLDGGVPVNARDGRGNSALMAAALGGQPALVLHLLACGADVDAMAPAGTALGMAALADRGEVIETLLDAGENPNAASRVGSTPLMLGARAGSLSAVRVLLASGANVEATIRTSVRIEGLPGDTLGFTALAFAVLFDHPDVIRTLWDHGGRLDPALSQGFTLLTLAASHGNEPAVRMLLALGADPAQPILRGHFAGSTPASLAVSRGRVALGELLAKYASVLETRDRQTA